MRVNTRPVRIEWAHCDPIGLVYYPRYFELFDSATTALFEAALGMTKYRFVRHYGVLGYAMVEMRASFKLPMRYGDDGAIDTRVTAFRRSSFDVHHRLLKDGALAVEGFETRVWVARDPADPSRIKAQTIPDEVVRALSDAP